MPDSVSVIIPLDEYNELKRIENEFKTAFESGAMILHHNDYFTGGPGAHIAHRYSIVNETQVVSNLNEDLKNTKAMLVSQRSANYELQSQLKKRCRRWFGL